MLNIFTFPALSAKYDFFLNDIKLEISYWKPFFSKKNFKKGNNIELQFFQKVDKGNQKCIWYPQPK